MGLYKLFSYNVEIQYKSSILSKAMLFTIITSLLNVILPFILAYKGRGFWLKSHNFHEQPTVHFTYEYLLVVETEDPSQPIICGDIPLMPGSPFSSQENCMEFQVQEYDYNKDGKNDILDFKFKVNIPLERTVTSVLLILELDFQLKTICPLHMQTLAIITKEFTVPPSGLKFYGDLQVYQVAHLPCLLHHIDTNYNSSLFNNVEMTNENAVDNILEHYFQRKVITETKTIFSRSQNGVTGTLDIKAQLRVPEMQILYTPSILQELKWAWPQYLSLVVIFYWIFDRIKRFVFNNRLLMAWEVVPWKRSY